MAIKTTTYYALSFFVFCLLLCINSVSVEGLKKTTQLLIRWKKNVISQKLQKRENPETNKQHNKILC